MKIFSNKETDYFGLFESSIIYSSRAAQALNKAFEDNIIDYKEMQHLRDIEYEADKHVHKCLKLIEDAFVTPIDREDLVAIVKSIEDLTDDIDAISNHTYMMCVEKVNQHARKLINLVVEACTNLEVLMKSLKNYKKDPKKIDEFVVKVNNIEEEGDKIYFNAMRELFEHENDAKKIIVYKTLYEKLETALNRCEEVADMIQRIIIAKT